MQMRGLRGRISDLQHPPISRCKSKISYQSGVLEVCRQGDMFVLDLPSREAEHCDTPQPLLEGLGTPPVQLLSAYAYLAVFDNERDVSTLQPDFAKLAALARTVIVTAPGTSVDFVSRYFAPGLGVPEDPVTGSAGLERRSDVIPHPRPT